MRGKCTNTMIEIINYRASVRRVGEGRREESYEYCGEGEGSGGLLNPGNSIHPAEHETKRGRENESSKNCIPHPIDTFELFEKPG